MVLQFSSNRLFMLLSAYRLVLFSTLLILLVCATAASAQQPLGELHATDASVEGSVILAGASTSVLSGSSIEAKVQIATLKLERGGSLLVCPGTKLTITASQNGHELMFSLNSGNLEMDYQLGAAADTLLTRELRLLIPGPGKLHQAVRVSPNGDTCVQSLPSNATWIVVSETKGDATYQLRPDEAVVFQGGHISGALPTRQNCGCPAPPPTSVAIATPPPAEPGPAQPSPMRQPVVANEHVSVEAPSVVRADDLTPNHAATIAALKLEHNKPVSFDALSPNVQAAAPISSKTYSASGYKEPATLNTARDRSGHFAVQVGAFKVKENAYRLADRLKNKRYEVEVVQCEDSAHQLWYLVRVGRYADRALARSVAAKLASEDDLGLKPFICVM
jgi:septal ring-binding cell division protein DamX